MPSERAITAYALANCTQYPRLVFRNSRIAEPLSRVPTLVSYWKSVARKYSLSARAFAYGVVAPAPITTCCASLRIWSMSSPVGKEVNGCSSDGTGASVAAISCALNWVPASGGSADATE